MKKLFLVLFLLAISIPANADEVCGVYMDIGYMTARDIAVGDEIIPTVLFKEIGPFTFLVIEYIDSDGVKHIIED